MGSLENYRKTGHRLVEGWLLPDAIEATCDLAARQRSQGIEGPVCEIGVHHGRLFILLHLLSAANERSLAIDLFEMQAENIDGSGKGSREHLLRNLRVHGCDLTRIELLAENSLRLTVAQIVELSGGRPRLFSIDGGHTAEATCNDLSLAHDAVCDGGLVILDDYFNSSWPAVSEGTCAFMRDHNRHLWPVAITANKFFLAKGETAAANYLGQMRATRLNVKVSTVFGHDVACIEPPTLRQRISANPHWHKVRKTAAGAALRNALKRWM